MIPVSLESYIKGTSDNTTGFFQWYPQSSMENPPIPAFPASVFQIWWYCTQWLDEVLGM